MSTQDHLSGTALVSDSSGDLVDDISYYPYGSTRVGDVPTNKKFTGQRLDGTGLYYYGARYYDPITGRFISADTIVPDPMNPQNFNRYSYCVNNPLRYVDPTGHNTIELNIPQEWLEYSWLERLLYLTPEERAYLEFALNPPPIEGDLLPVNDTSWDEALMNAWPGYLLEVSWGSLMTYEYVIVESDSINTPIDVSYLESTSAWECPGVEYLGGTELVVVVMRNAPGYLKCSYNVQFTWGTPYPYVLRTKEDLLIELDICIEKYGQPQITLYSPYGNMVGQWGDEWNLVGDMPPKTIAQEIGKEVVEFWVDFIIKKIVGGYFFGD